MRIPESAAQDLHEMLYHELRAAYVDCLADGVPRKVLHAELDRRRTAILRRTEAASGEPGESFTVSRARASRRGETSDID